MHTDQEKIFHENKAKVLEALNTVIAESCEKYNKAQEGLSNGLFTAATAYIAIVLAFFSNLKGAFGENSWIIAASIISFSASLVPWVIDKITASIACNRNIKISKDLSKITMDEVWDESSLIAMNKIASKLLDGKKTSSIPIISQITLFFIGVLFATIIVAIALL